MNRRAISGLIFVVAAFLSAFRSASAVVAEQSLPMLDLGSVGKNQAAKPFDFKSRFAQTGNNFTILQLEPLKPVPIGDHPVVIAHLIAAGTGKPIPNQLIRIFAYKDHYAQAVTDNTGTAQITLRWNVQVGTYNLMAVFINGKQSVWETSYAFATLTIVPAQVVIKTVPPLAGIRFSFNNETYVSDADGLVKIQVNHIGTYPLEVLTVAPDSGSTARIEFSRWNDEVYDAHRDVRVPLHRTLEAGFLISYPVNFKFIEPSGKTVDPTRISALTLTAAGTTYTFTDANLHWLPAIRLARRLGSSLEVLDVNYAIRTVTIDGSNIVNDGQQRFTLRKPNEVWNIQVLMYSARFLGLDAIFHTPIGSGVHLEYPDGTTQVFKFDAKHQVQVSSLARGLYHAKVVGGSGSAPLTPMFLSRDQDVELLVISRLDLLILLGIPGSIALILLYIGRLHFLLFSAEGLVWRIFRRKKRGDIEPKIKAAQPDQVVVVPPADHEVSQPSDVDMRKADAPPQVNEAPNSMMAAESVSSDDVVSEPYPAVSNSNLSEPDSVPADFAQVTSSPESEPGSPDEATSVVVPEVTPSPKADQSNAHSTGKRSRRRAKLRGNDDRKQQR